MAQALASGSERGSGDEGQPRWLRVEAPAPYSLEHTVQVLRRLPQNPVDRWDGTTYTRAVETTAGPRLLLVRQRGGVDAGVVELAVAPDPVATTDLSRVVELARRVLGFGARVQPCAAAFHAEPGLREVRERFRGLHPPRFPALFEALGSVVPFQQVSLQAGMSLLDRLVRTFGVRVAWRGAEGWLFPTAERIANAPREALRDCGLSGAKADALRSLAATVASGGLREEELEALPTDEALRRLDDLPGVGPWTAGVVLVRGLGRLDIFPSGDAGARRGLAALLGRPAPLDPEEEARLLERLGPCRGLLYFYTLGHYLDRRGLLSDPGSVPGVPPPAARIGPGSAE